MTEDAAQEIADALDAIHAALSGCLVFSGATMRKTHNGPVWRSMALFRHIGRFDIHSKDFKHG